MVADAVKEIVERSRVATRLLVEKVGGYIITPGICKHHGSSKHNT